MLSFITFHTFNVKFTVVTNRALANYPADDSAEALMTAGTGPNLLCFVYFLRPSPPYLLALAITEIGDTHKVLVY